MASSEVELVSSTSSSSSPFGCVLKDHNLRAPRPPTATPAKCQPNLQKTLKELVREHLRSSISPSNENSNSNHNPNQLKSRWQVKAKISREPSPAPSDDCVQTPAIPSRNNSLGSDNDSTTSDWESDQAEKLRVVDIIRRLPLAVPLRKLPECGEGPTLFSPRIRGRQAVADLFARLARDRYHEVETLAELHTVSKFPKRGRIQSLLKIRLLTRKASVYSQWHYQEPRVYESSKSTRQRISSVKSLRRRFSTAAAENNDSGNKSNSQMEDSSNNLVVDKVSTSNPPSEVAEQCNENSQEEMNFGRINDENVSTSNQPLEVAEESNGDYQEETRNYEDEKIELLSTNVRSESNDQQNEESTSVRSEGDDQQNEEEGNLTEVVLQAETEDVEQEIPSPDVVWRESGSDEETIDYGSPVRMDTIEWEEDDEDEVVDNEEYYDDDDDDWIHDISRPRSYWESRRRSRYEEILESSANNEIRQLIERGSVSAVLTSDFRDRMDQLMISSAQLQMHPISCESGKKSLSGSLKEEEEQNEEHEVVIHGEESREVEPIQEEEAIREEDMDQNEDIEEEDEGQSLSYYREQTPLLELPWSSYQEQDDSDDFERIESATRRQESFITNSYDHGSQVGSSIKNGSITEMELICDIRAHMQQMYREMSELRKTVSSCVDMQSKLQSSIREEVSAAIREEVLAAMRHLSSDKTEGRESKRNPRKGSCCICYEKKADSVLYRCGHMCTCFECGSELKWSSGKCPICWVQIADVIQVCTDYY